MKSSSYAAFSGVKDKSTRRATDTDDLSFAKAFKHFKDDGRKTFTWRGKKYSTKTKAEEARRKPVMGSAKNIDPKALRSSGRPRKPVLGSSKNIPKSALKPVEKKPEKKARVLKTVVRPLPKMGSQKNIRGTKGEGGTKEVGKLRSKRLESKMGSGKNIRNTRGTGAMFQDARRSDFRTTGQMLKDLDFKDAFKDAMKRGKLRFSQGGAVKKADGIAIKGKTKCKMR
tara:strand:+ start:9494 stop:10174 length:681 start_codon:yes stop_codon:yes gene_type:complete